MIYRTMMYVLVENGIALQGPCMLPQNWMNVSGFNLITDLDFIRSYGWYPYVFVPYQGDMSTKVIIQSRIEITETEYIEYQQVRDKTQEEIDSETEGKWENVRAQRNIYLQESDWTQLTDVSFDAETEVAWKEYRRKLRDITNFPSPDAVIWPEKPVPSPVLDVAPSLDSSSPTGPSLDSSSPTGPSLDSSSPTGPTGSSTPAP
jgi:hypothetical protein